MIKQHFKMYKAGKRWLIVAIDYAVVSGWNGVQQL